MYGAWSEMLKECHAAFGPAPRRFSMWDRLNYMRIAKPSWMNSHPSQNLANLLDAQSELFRDGQLVWGQIVQANQLLFEKGKDNCPALVLFAPDPEMQMDPQLLEDVAHRSFELKNTQPREKDKLELAKLLTDEMAQPMGYSVPRSLCSIGSLMMSVTFFARHHLPQRKLSAGVFPMVRHAEHQAWVLPLPERYWPKRLIEWWVS